MTGAEPISWIDMSLAALLLAINAGISLAFGMRLERSLAIAAVRMVLQLSAVGFVLKIVFAQTSPLWTALVGIIMALVAGFELISRQDKRLRTLVTFGLGSGTLLLVGALGTLYTTAIVIGPTPWYAPRYVLPILGMVLGNALTSASLVLQTLNDAAERDRGVIENRLSLGATRFTAFATILARALKTAMTPLLNSMSVTGVVALPGMMTGQILAGADPSGAARYQIVIMFVLAGASGLGALIAALGGVMLITDRRHRLRLGGA
ncbi:MAG: iron export ABC transporter permease subunit FetB [Hyphomicrobiales bacterium]|nr:MAG: iron export ABC transporter permease subunit FetB [Hyphomicrobiales bacterium]